MLLKVKGGLPILNAPSNENALYYDGNILYICQQGSYPSSYTLPGLDKLEEKAVSEIPQDFILKLIAIGNKPERVHDFV